MRERNWIVAAVRLDARVANMLTLDVARRLARRAHKVKMNRVTSAMIDLAEASYDLEVSDSDWLPKVMQAGLPVLDHGLGVAGWVYTRPLDGGEVTLDHLHVGAGPQDFALRQARVCAECPAEIRKAFTRPGVCMTLSEAAGEKYANAVESWTRHHDSAKDALGLSAVDSDGQGALIISPLPELTTLSGHLRHRWQMVGAHLTTGFRLRRALKKANENPVPQESESTAALRDGAALVDRARGRMRKTDPDEALKIWKSLVEGRWSMVDWFDSDSRRFVLAIRNPPGISDPHGLSKRESQVATYAALGESGKLIGYRLGLSPSRVSALLQDAMRKLRVNTQPELVERMRWLGAVDGVL